MGFEVGVIGIEAQLENARGLTNVNAEASPRLQTLIYGSGDFMAFDRHFHTGRTLSGPSLVEGYEQTLEFFPGLQQTVSSWWHFSSNEKSGSSSGVRWTGWDAARFSWPPSQEAAGPRTLSLHKNGAGQNT